MKKLLFTAVAVVAFSGVAMANTIVDRGIEKKEVEKVSMVNTIGIKYDSNIIIFDCCKYYDLVYDYMIEEGYSQMEAGTEANIFENNCEARQ